MTCSHALVYLRRRERNGFYHGDFIEKWGICSDEVLKHITWLDKHVPTAAVVIVLSLVLCPVGFAGLAKYYKIALDWFMVFASFIAAFIVALVSMDGWEKFYELKERFVNGKE